MATNASGTTYGPDQTFTTASAPTANTLAATGATLTGGTLHGSIDPQGQATTYHFDWGTSTAYGSQAPLADASVGSDSSEHAVEQTLSELTPDTSYHFRVVASNCGGCAEGTTYGPDETFTTAPAPLAVTRRRRPWAEHRDARGIVNPQGARRPTTSIGARHRLRQPGADRRAPSAPTAPNTPAQALTGLTPGTTYHYRIVASDCEGCASGTTYGSDARSRRRPRLTPGPPLCRS